MAKIGAHPFTTIEPNIGQAFYAIPCPCVQWNKQCHARYGHSAQGERFVPVLLKDVAGLVPGACEGSGRGNKFLNDLLDADVLIHVIDLSGQTDENGKPTTGKYWRLKFDLLVFFIKTFLVIINLFTPLEVTSI